MRKEFCVSFYLVYPTATPTPGSYEYVIATGSVGSLLVLLFGAVAIVIYLMWYLKQQEEQAPYRHEGTATATPRGTSPYTFSTSGVSSSASGSNVSRMTASQYMYNLKQSAPVQHSVV